uniref:hypothetical protein n=1 Tax=Nocardia brasiliensis TaxID=37326 RepID=UPI0024539BE7
MSLATQLADLSTRVGTEFKTVRTEIAAVDGGDTNLGAPHTAGDTIKTSPTRPHATKPPGDGPKPRREKSLRER